MSTTPSQLRKLFSAFGKLKVFVVGDVMLDNYWHGDINRISPEAPVPVVQVTKKESRPGGAANVALNCKALGADVYLLSVLGKDNEGSELIRQLEENKIKTEFCLQRKHRRTSSKTRLMARNQQVVRIDEESDEELNTSDEHQFIDMCLRAIQIEVPDILIFEDYNKGVLKDNIITKIITHCKHVKVLTAVDPKLKNFFSYKGVDIFKPNVKEVKEALQAENISLNIANLKQVHKALLHKLNHKHTLITLSEKGIFVANSNQAKILDAYKRAIADVSGAGDTVIAVAALTYAITQNAPLMASLSNLAGGIVCESVGVVPIQKGKLLQEAIDKLCN